MKKIIHFALAAAMIAAVSCNNPGDPEREPSLTVNPSELTFEASDTGGQIVQVTAVGMEWEFSVNDETDKWLDVVREDDALRISVTENLRADGRSGIVMVRSVGTAKPVERMVTVTQRGSDDPVELSLEVVPVSLTFAGEGADSQDVEVTVGGDLEWSAVAAEHWITVTPVEGGFTVAVADNPETDERRGTVTVTPDADSVEPVGVSVIQEGKVLPPEFSVDKQELFFSYNLLGEGGNAQKINVHAVSVEWDVSIEPEKEGDDAGWLSFMIDYMAVSAIVEANRSFEERTAYVVFTTDWDEVPEIRVKVTQEAAKEYLSTLTGDVDFTGRVNKMRGELWPSQSWADADIAEWTMALYGDGVEYNGGIYSGEGVVLKFDLITDRVDFNEENVYYIESRKYEVVPATNADGRRAGTVQAGRAATSPFNPYPNFYYLEYGGGENVSASAPVTSGSVEVSRDGEEYTFVVDVYDDFGWHITGTYTGRLDLTVNGEIEENPEG